jgi:hypothetical protein
VDSPVQWHADDQFSLESNRVKIANPSRRIFMVDLVDLAPYLQRPHAGRGPGHVAEEDVSRLHFASVSSSFAVAGVRELRVLPDLSPRLDREEVDVVLRHDVDHRNTRCGSLESTAL